MIFNQFLHYYIRIICKYYYYYLFISIRYVKTFLNILNLLNNFEVLLYRSIYIIII